MEDTSILRALKVESTILDSTFTSLILAGLSRIHTHIHTHTLKE